jgi:sulfite exporter TauE/SafE
MSFLGIAPGLLASSGAVALASLLGSVHCAGMCGGLSACATPRGPLQRRSDEADRAVALTTSIGGRRRTLRDIGSTALGMQVAYHGARLVGYALLGAVAGSVGAALNLGGSLVGVQRVASIAAGATIAVLGAVMLLRIAGARIPHVTMPGLFVRMFQSAQRRAAGWPPMSRSAAIGAVTPLLPCGWLYAFVAIAAGAGSALGGALLMSAFWIGTVPALVVVAVGVRFVLASPSIRRFAPIAAALLMIGVGVHLAVVRGGKAAVVAASVHPVDVVASNEAVTEAGASAMLERIDQVDDELPACCRGEGEQ